MKLSNRAYDMVLASSMFCSGLLTADVIFKVFNKPVVTEVEKRPLQAGDLIHNKLIPTWRGVVLSIDNSNHTMIARIINGADYTWVDPNLYPVEWERN